MSVDPNPGTGVFLRRGVFGHIQRGENHAKVETQGRRACEDGGRDRRDAPPSQGATSEAGGVIRVLF